jgi:hypothetical protein
MPLSQGSAILILPGTASRAPQACATPQRPGKLLNACVEVHIVQTGPLAGYVPDFSEYVLGPVPLPRPVPPGISVQGLGTFGFQLTNLELAPLAACRREQSDSGLHGAWVKHWWPTPKAVARFGRLCTFHRSFFRHQTS